MATKAPNIIFLMSDQHRWDALGCVRPVVRTPNLDALARAGVRFEQAVCNAPMCVPSRYSMMTGLYPSQCGVRHNTQMCPSDAELPVAVLAQRLRDRGYQTAGVGKTHWYIGGEIMPEAPVRPSTRGFEHRWIARRREEGDSVEPSTIMGDDLPDGAAKLRDETKPFGPGGESILGYTGCTSVVPVDEHREGWLTNKALEFLERQRDPSRPLFLYLSFDSPHAGLNVPKGYEDLYRLEDMPLATVPPWNEHPPGHVGADWRRREWLKRTPDQQRLTTLRYFALCSFVDDLYGRVLRKLEAMGELANTLVLFTSDHGESLWDRQRFGKYSLYESSVRVPLILSGSALPRSLAGTVDQRPAELVDIVPTLLHAVGAAAAPELSGGSLLAAPCRRSSFCEMHGSGYEKAQLGPSYLWRERGWKLILSLPGPIEGAALRLDRIIGELYDLSADPLEFRNLYDEPAQRERRERMTRELLMQLACSWARFPDRPTRARLVAEPLAGAAVG